MTDLIWSFVPWMLFLLTDRFVPFGVALAAAGAAAAVVFVRAFRRHHVHMLDVANVVYFAALGLLVVALRPSDLDTWSRYAQGGAHAFLTVLVLGSVIIGHPFTEGYARQQVPESFWHTDTFHELNRRLSMVWGAAFLVGTISLLAAGAVDGRQALLRVVIPFGALALALLYTQKQSERRESSAPRAVAS